MYFSPPIILAETTAWGTRRDHAPDTRRCVTTILRTHKDAMQSVHRNKSRQCKRSNGDDDCNVSRRGSRIESPKPYCGGRTGVLRRAADTKHSAQARTSQLINEINVSGQSRPLARLCGGRGGQTSWFGETARDSVKPGAPRGNCSARACHANAYAPRKSFRTWGTRYI